MRYLLILFIVLASALMSGCNSAISNLKPFKLEIQQGNVVTSKMLLQLRPGMTKSQVRYIMGTPLIVDSFHSNRWDYIFQLRQAGKITEQKRVVLDFESELLKSVRGDVMQTADVGVVKLTPAAEATAPKTKNSKDSTGESFSDKLKFWKDDKPATPVEANAEATKPSPVILPATNSEIVAPVVPAIKATEGVTAAAVVGGGADSSTKNAELLALPTPPAIGPSIIAPNEAAVITQSIPDSSASMPSPAEPVVSAMTPANIEEQPIVTTTKSNTGALADYELKFDRTLDFKRGNVTNETKSSEIKSLVTPNKNSPIKSTTSQPDTEPGYFERILEKIGF